MSWSVDGSLRRPVEVTALLRRARVVLCIAIALAAADLGGGAYFDEHRGFVVEAGAHDPREMIARTRLAPNDLTFAERCERYLAGGKAKPPQP
ncbi:hypothetical protein [Lentzea sp. NPDC004782]|uniref:hypothetical protein n=1 Tax=Lentzea sp. NPDC004782 TaxID=3154458 RepID=UPI0033A06DC9